MRHHEEIDNIDIATDTDIEIQRGGVVYPLKVVKKKMTRHVNLLLTEQDGLRHYCAITNFSRLVGSQYTKCKKTHFYCYSCLHGFVPTKGEKDRSECVLLQEHQKYCKALKPQRVSYPEKDDKQLKTPFVVYADFESSLKPEGEGDVTTGLTTEKKKGRVYQTDEAASYWYKFVSIDPDFHMPEKNIYVGKYAAEHMLDELKEDAEKIFTNNIKKPKSVELTPEEQRHFNAATVCHICG